MARRRLGDAAQSPIAAFLDRPSEKISGATRARKLSDLEANLRIAEDRALTGDWSGATGPTFVGLYALCHRVVYDVLPLELESVAEFRAASKLALTCLHAHFDDDVDALARFVKWAWDRERSRSAWAREKGFDKKRLGWRLVFSASMVTDYRAASGRVRTG